MVIFIVMVIVIVMVMIISIVIVTVMVAFPVGERSWQALSAPACIPRMTETSKARHIKSSDIGILWKCHCRFGLISKLAT